MSGTRQVVGTMTRYEILDALLEDGYRIDPGDAYDIARTIQLAARMGALTWSHGRIVSVLRTRPLTLVARRRMMTPVPR